MKQRYIKRISAAKKFLGGKCVRCGSVENLQFDHIDPTTKVNPVTRNNFTVENFWKEVKKCQLLCFDCHKLKTHEDRLARLVQ